MLECRSSDSAEGTLHCTDQGNLEGTQILIGSINGDLRTAHVSPGITTGADVKRELTLDMTMNCVLVSPNRHRVAMQGKEEIITQDMLDSSGGARWILVVLYAEIRLRGGQELGNMARYSPDVPTAILLSGTYLQAEVVKILERSGMELGVYTDHDMTGERKLGKWREEHTVRLYSDITWPGHEQVVCVAISNFPHPRAYAEYPDDLFRFSRSTPEHYMDKYKLAMDAVLQHCSHEVQGFATVPMGTNFGHIVSGDVEFLLSKIGPALREYLAEQSTASTLDILVYEERLIPFIAPGVDKVELPTS